MESLIIVLTGDMYIGHIVIRDLGVPLELVLILLEKVKTC